MYLAASATTSDVLGSVGYGGLALVLSIFMVRACKRNKLKPRALLVIGFIAGSCYLQAGGAWRIPQRLVGVLYHLAHVGSGTSGPFGTIGTGAVALGIAAIAWLDDLSRGWNARLGIVAAIVFAGSGGVWTYLAQIGSGISSQVGG